MPGCTSPGAVLDAQTLTDAMRMLVSAVSGAALAIFTDSYISLAALCFMFLISFGFACSGGVGASMLQPPSLTAKFAKGEASISSRLALRCVQVLSQDRGCQLYTGSVHASRSQHVGPCLERCSRNIT